MPAALKPVAVGGLAVGVIAGAVAGLPALDVGAVATAGWMAATGVVVVARRIRGINGRHAVEETDRPNPYAVPQPWRDLIADVLRSQQKFVETATAGPSGPIRSRLSALTSRVEDGVRESWLIAQRGASLNQAVARLDPGEIRRRLAIVEAEQAGDGRVETLAALRAQIASVQRIEGLAEETRGRLQVLAARLGEAVAAAVELSVAADGTGDVGLDGVAAGIDQVVAELHAVRAALTETSEATERSAEATTQPPG